MSTTVKDVALIPTSPAEVAKALVYIALAAVAILVTALADNLLTPVELIQVGIVVAGAIPVYLLAGTVPKTVAAFVVAAGQAVLLIVVDVGSFADVPLAAWLGVVVSAFAAIGVAVVPNAGKPAQGMVASVNVQTAAYGAPASAEVSGPPSARHVTFSIPRGQVGERGSSPRG